MAPFGGHEDQGGQEESPILRILLAVHQVLLGIGLGGVHGTIRSAATGVPVSDAQLTIDGTTHVRSDSAGRYVVGALSVGFHDLRIEAIGYQPRDVGIDLPDSLDMPLDVALNPSITVLPDINVAVAAGRPGSGAGASGLAPAPGERLGEYRLDPGWQADAVARGVDAFGALLGAPGVEGRAGMATSLSVHGGGAMENEVLLDGIPLFDATHYAATASAVEPEAIATLGLYTGVLPTRFGTRLSSIIDMQTADSGTAGVGSAGAVDLADARSLIRGPLGTNGGFVLAGRASFRNLLSDGDGVTTLNGYRDFTGSARAGLLGGTLRLVGFATGNTLGLEPVAATAAARAEGDLSGVTATAPDLRWGSTSVGASWSGEGPRGTLSIRGWWAGAHADIGWPTTDVMQRLYSTVGEAGLQGDFVTGGLQAGVSLLHPATDYVVTSSTSSVAPLALHAAPWVASAYFDASRRLRRLTLEGGMRATTDPTGGVMFDPRATVSFAINADTRLDVAAGGAHQVLQPMLNDENLLGSVVGIDLPVASGHGIPTARSSEVNVGLRHQFSESFSMSLEGYARRWNGLVLPAASTVGLFVTDSIATGAGTARGVTAGATLVRGRLVWQAALTVGRSNRTAGDLVYRSGFDRPWSLNSALSWRLGTGTLAQVALAAGAGNPVSAVASPVDWRPYQSFGGGDLGGTPVMAGGMVNALRLPDMTRVDVGLRRSWPVAIGGRHQTLLTTVRVDNLFGARDPVGVAQLGDGTLHLLRGTPRGLSVELGWIF